MTSLPPHTLSAVLSCISVQWASLSSLFLGPGNTHIEVKGENEQVEHMKAKEEEIPLEIGRGR